MDPKLKTFALCTQNACFNKIFGFIFIRIIPKGFLNDDELSDTINAK